MKLSIRSRLTLAATAGFGVLLILFTTVVFFFLSEDIEKKLREDSLHDMNVLMEALTSSEWRLEVADLPAESEEFRLDIRVLDEYGLVVLQTGTLQFDDWPIDIQKIRTETENHVVFWENIESESESYLGLTCSFIPPDAPRHFVQIANSRSDKKWILSAYVYHSNVGAFLILMVAILGCFYFSKKALEPVEDIRSRAALIDASHLSERLSYNGPKDELSRLTDTLNGLLGRVEASMVEMRRFVADASHELRIPVTGIRGTVEVALRQERTSEQYRETLETVHRESERLSEIIQDLLSLARADAGQLELQKSTVKIDQFLQAVLDDAMALNIEQKVNLTAGQLPVGSARFDEMKIHRLLINLIENAIAYNKPGGDVSLSATLTSSHVTFVVKDTGIGISEDDQKKIFERFYRVDKSRSREKGGTGLGLSIAKTIAVAHKGSLNVQSRLGHGSEFVLILPIE